MTSTSCKRWHVKQKCFSKWKGFFFRSPLPQDFTMLPEAAYQAKATKPAAPNLSGMETRDRGGVTGQETSPDQEIKNHQNTRQSGINPKRKGDYHQDKGRPPLAKSQDGRENGNRPTTSGAETSQRNSGSAEPIKCWGCGSIGYWRSFCPECSGNENWRDETGPNPSRLRKGP